MSTNLSKKWAAHQAKFQLIETPGKEVVVGFSFVNGVGHRRIWVLAVNGDGNVSLHHRSNEDADAGMLAEIQDGAWDGILDATNGRSSPSLKTFLYLTGLIEGPGKSLASLSATEFIDGDPDIRDADPSAREALYVKLHEQEKTRLLEPLRSVIAPYFDGEVLAALSGAHDYTMAEYRFYAQPGDRGLFRRQAAESLPLLADEISRRPTLKRAVDTKQPLNAALAKLFVSDTTGEPLFGKAVLKRLRPLKSAPAGMTLVKMADVIGCLPPDWLPRDDQEWQRMSTISSGVVTSGLIGSTGGLSGEDLFKGCSGKWLDFAQRLAVAYTDTRPPEGLTEQELANWQPEDPVFSEARYEAALSNVVDMSRFFAYQVLLPTIARTIGDEQPSLEAFHYENAIKLSMKVLFKSKSLPQILEMARHWHSQMEHIRTEVCDEKPIDVTDMLDVPENGWPPLFSGIIEAPNGVAIYPLFTQEMLSEEGGHMRVVPDANGVDSLGHCVAGYAGSCRSGASHIVSLREVDRNGNYCKRLATLQIGSFAQGEMPRSMQIRGKENQKPPARALQAKEWLFQAIFRGDVAVNHDGVMQFQAALQASSRLEKLGILAGYDWRDEGKIENAINSWSIYLNKNIRKFGVSALQKDPDVVSLAENIRPGYTSLSISP